MHAARCCLLIALALLCGLARAASSYTFRSDSYAWETAANAVSWDRTCTSYPGDDDKATLSFTGGFKFNFAGTAYSSVRVLANGGLQFGGDTGFFRTYTNTALPAGTPAGSGSGCAATATNNVILAYWTDLNPSQAGSGGVTWEQKGTAPNRYVVVSWNGVYQYSTTTPYTFQIVLYESASGVNGEFKFQYGNANASGSNATIGVQVNSSDYTQYSYNSGYNANGSAIRWFVPSGTPTRRAEYRFDEYGYSGRVGEVLDSSGNGNNGVRVGSATTLPGGYVCRGLSIPADTSGTGNAVDTLLDVNSAIGDKGAVTFWYAANTAWNNSAAMLLDATTSTSRPFFLVRQADGSLRATIADGNGTLLSAVTAAQTTGAGGWKHIAVSWRLANGTGQSSLRIYINGLQAGAASGTTTGSLDNSIGTLFVGNNRSTAAPANSTTNSGNGVFDEMRVYNYDISAVELTADMSPSHACPPPLDHYEVWLPSTGLTCLPTTVTVKACATNASACVVETSVNGSATLATSAGTLASTTLTFSNGVATTTLSLPGGADGATATLSLGNESTPAANARQCCPNGSSCYAANSCSTTFNQAGFIVSTAADGGPATLTPQTAGAPSSLFLRAIRKNSSTQACEAAVTGSRTVNWAYECNNPAHCGGASLMSIDGGTATAILGVGNGAALQYTGVTMSFDANGAAPFKLSFADVGQTTLYTNLSVPNGDVLGGKAGPFVTKPARFDFSNIVTTAGAANPGALDDTGRLFTRAGAAFGARITAVTAGGAATPSFGKETPAEGVLLAPVLVQPVGGAMGSLANASVPGSQFSAGVATVVNLAYDEVGVIRLKAAVADADYLGGGDVSGAPSTTIGRFAPAGFTATPLAPTHRTALACSPASTFTYLDENFQLAFKLSAVNAQGQVTRNYVGGFARLDLGAASGFRLAGVDAATGTRFAGAQLSVGASSGSWAALGDPAPGTADVRLTAAALRGSSPGGPYTASFGIAPLDGDGVGMLAFDLDTDAAVAGNDRATVGQIPLRQGRLRLQNGMSAPGRDLKLALSAQFWNGNAFVTNILDSCSTVTAANLNFGNFRKQLGSADAAMSPAAVTVNPNAPTFITLTKPSGNRVGSLDVAIALAPGANPADASCLRTQAGWAPAVAASAGANIPALRGAWCGATSDPSARATWGLYRGADGVIYQRENF